MIIIKCSGDTMKKRFVYCLILVIITLIMFFILKEDILQLNIK